MMKLCPARNAAGTDNKPSGAFKLHFCIHELFTLNTIQHMQNVDSFQAAAGKVTAGLVESNGSLPPGG